MAKYIDSAELENRIQLIECGVLNIPIREIFDDVVRSCRGADVAPVIHAEWLWRTGFDENEFWLECSNCGGEQNYYGDTDYCPNCGAKMELKEDRK